MAYTIKPGDTLSGLALSNKTDVATLQKLNPQITDPNKIYAGQNLNLLNLPTFASPTNPIPMAGPTQLGPVKQEIPGVGTLTTLPKTLAPALPNAPADNIQGAMDRFGIQKAPELTPPNPSTPETPSPLVPTFGTKYANSPVINAINTISSTLDTISKNIVSSKKATPEELQLAKDLQAKKATLETFDTQTLQRIEGFSGKGQGATTEMVGLQQDKERRTRALERLGIAQDVGNLTAQLGLTQDQRKEAGASAETEYNLASKKVDLALGVFKEMERLDDQTKDDARKYLLDVVDFSKGKTWEQLDLNTQAQIIKSTADSPITLGMVKSALEHSSNDLTYSIQDIGGRTIRFGFNKDGKTVSKTDLGSSSKAKDIFEEAKNIIDQYFKNGITRDQIEKQYEDADKTVPLDVQKALDTTYGKNAQPEKKSHKGGFLNPLNWFSK